MTTVEVIQKLAVYSLNYSWILLNILLFCTYHGEGVLVSGGWLEAWRPSTQGASRSLSETETGIEDPKSALLLCI